MFSGGDEALEEGADNGVVLNGGEHGHEQDGSDTSSAAANAAFAAQDAAVAVVGCDADKGGYLLIGQLGEFGQLGEQCVGEGLADTGHGEDEVALFTPFGDGVDGVA